MPEPEFGVPQTINLVQEWNAAVETVKYTDFHVVMQYYIKRVDESFSTPGYKAGHVSGALNGTAKIWETAKRCHKGPQTLLEPEIEQFLLRTLHRLQKVLPTCGCREASNIFWSFAKLGVNPDHLTPGIVDQLAKRFIAAIHNSNGESYSGVFLACLDLGIDPCQGQLLDVMLEHLDPWFAGSLDSSMLSRLIFSLARLALPHTADVIDVLCDAFQARLKLHGGEMTAFNVSSFSWSLFRLKHKPSDTLASLMFNKMMTFCQSTSREVQPTAQQVSNFLLACAELDFKPSRQDLQTLIAQLDRCGTRYPQDVSNTVWSFAIMGNLTEVMFQRQLKYLCGPTASRLKLYESNTAQLYQALDFLQPPRHNPDLTVQEKYQSWLKLAAELQRIVGPRVQSRKPSSTQEGQLQDALSRLRLQHTGPALVHDPYWVDAVVHPQTNEHRPILFTRLQNHLSNQTG